MKYLLQLDDDSCGIHHGFTEEEIQGGNPYAIVIDTSRHEYVEDRLRLLKAIEGLADVLDPPSDVPLLYQTIRTLLEGAFVIGRKYQRDNPKEEVEEPKFF